MTQSLAFPAFRKGKPITKKSWRQSVGLYCLLQCGLALNISVTPSQRSVLSLEMSAEGDEMVEPVLFPWCSSLWRGIPHGRELISVPWEKPLAQHISCPVLSTGIGWEGLSPMRRWGCFGADISSAFQILPHLPLASLWLAVFPALLEGLWDEWHPKTLCYLNKHLVLHFLSTENQVSEHTACLEWVDEEVRVFLVLPAFIKKIS